MSISQIIDSFFAFNINSINNIIYMIQNNLAILMSIAGASTIIVLNLKEEMEDYVTEEQNII